MIKKRVKKALRERMFQTFMKQIELGVWVCYNDNATQLHIDTRKVYIFIFR